jgi:hypothetical protein
MGLGRTWAAWLCASAALSACGPRLTDTPTEFVGDDVARIATLCSDDEVAAGEQRKYWVKFLTVHHADWSVDWREGTLEVEGGVIVRRAAGQPSQREDGTWARFETYWIQTAPGAKAGDTVQVGPLSYDLHAAGRGAKRVVGGRCTATVSG